MKLNNLNYAVASIAIVCTLMFPQAAHAYGELTTAAYSSQLIVAAIMGGFLSIRMLPALAREFFKSLVKGNGKPRHL